MRTIEEIDLKQLIENETGERFNRAKKIKSPFNSSDDTPSFSIYFNSNLNKWKFKDFSTKEEGDALDFIQIYRNLDYVQAREYLGMEVEKTEAENFEDKVRSYIDYQLQSFRKGQKLLGIFTFVDRNNNPIYCKAKFIKSDGKKETPYYSIDETGQVINSRGHEEVPYNLYNVIKAIENDKRVIIVEGEKDANTLNSLLRMHGYVSTSLKGCKDLSYLQIEGAKFLFLGDTGEAGSKYEKDIKDALKPNASEFRIVRLPGIKQLGDNKDVTDWLETGHTKEELLIAFKRSLDLKSLHELQQDAEGIYMPYVKEEDGEKTVKKCRYTDFTIEDAYRLKMVDEDREGIKVVFKNVKSGKMYERVGDVKVFNDIRSFRNFLGTMDLNFTQDKTSQVVKLGKWINDYWAIDNQEIYKGVQFKPIGPNLSLITPQGAITSKGTNTDFKTNDNVKLEVLEHNPITKEEMQELYKYLFKFTSPEKSLTIIGTIINNLCVYQCEELGISLHHLMIVGGSGSGKSHILKKVIAPILNLNESEINDIGNTSKFAFEKSLSTGNYTKIYDEFKPSMFSSQSKIKDLSGVLRNLYDRQTFSRGFKSFEVKSFRYSCPIVLAGEESYPNSESALINRSAICYISKEERTKKNTEAMEWLEDNKELLNKFGRSLVNMILNLPIEEYKELRKSKRDKFTVNDRVLNTAINISTGIEIYNKLLTSIGLENLVLQGYEKYIEANLKEEVLDGGEETKSIVEQMLLLFDEMVADNRVPYSGDVVRRYRKNNADTDYLLIRTSEMINQIHTFCKQVGSAELIPLKLRDFNKQSKKSRYKVTTKDGKERISQYVYVGANDKKSTWFDVYDLNKIRKLGCDTLAPLSEFEKQIEQSYRVGNNDNVVQGKFNY